MSESMTRELMRELTSDVPVSAPPLAQTIGGGRRLRQRRRAVAAAAAAAVVVGTLATAGLLGRTDDTSPDLTVPPAVQLDHAWWADGVLHLPSGAVPMSGVRELVQVPGGLVVLTDAGDVRRVDDDGQSQLIGRWRAGVPQDDIFPTVRAQDDGKVVWLDGSTSPEYSFVVYDPGTGRQVASHAIPTGGFHEAAYLNEFEDGVVYWDSAAYGQRAWNIDTGMVAKIGTGATLLRAVENGTWVTFGDRLTGTEASSDGQRLWATADDFASVSPDGGQVVTLPARPPIRFTLRDALTGRKIADPTRPPTLSAGMFLDRVYLGVNQRLSYVTGSEGPEGIVAPYELVTCDLSTARCTTVVSGAAERPVLPSD